MLSRPAIRRLLKRQGLTIYVKCRDAKYVALQGSKIQNLGFLRLRADIYLEQTLISEFRCTDDEVESSTVIIRNLETSDGPHVSQGYSA